MRSCCNGRPRSWGQTTLAVTVGFILLWELAGPWIWVWLISSSVSIHSKPSADSARLLLVADPQIQGFHDEPSGLVGYVTRWDAHSYVRSHVSAVYGLSQPEEVVFLGDLLDEGSTASNYEFSDYAYTFHRMFPWSRMPWQVFVAGDNDIGGEGSDRVTPKKAQRFSLHFGPLNAKKSARNRLQLFWVNSMALSVGFSGSPDTQLEAMNFITNHLATSPPGGDRAPIALLSHLPLQGILHHDQIVRLNIATAFTAHVHQFGITAYTRSTLSPIDWSREFYWHRTSVMRLGFESFPSCYHQGNCTLDVSVPSASYRMGTSKMGLVVVDLDAAGRVDQMFVIPLPPRYPVLILYLVVILFCLLLYLCRSC